MRRTSAWMGGCALPCIAEKGSSANVSDIPTREQQSLHSSYSQRDARAGRVRSKGVSLDARGRCRRKGRLMWTSGRHRRRDRQLEEDGAQCRWIGTGAGIEMPWIDRWRIRCHRIGVGRIGCGWEGDWSVPRLRHRGAALPARPPCQSARIRPARHTTTLTPILSLLLNEREKKK